MQGWIEVFLEPAKTVVAQISQFLLNILLVIVILIIGWCVARLLKTVITKILHSIKIDVLSERIELKNLLARGGITYPFSELIGMVFYWLTLLVTVVVAVNAIGLTRAADLLNNVILYIPNVIAAIFILVLGMFLATLLRNIVSTAASNAGLSQSALLAKVVEVIVIVFSLLVALEQLNIGARIIELTISILLASLGLGVALAFGLGCKDLAGKFMAELVESIRRKK